MRNPLMTVSGMMGSTLMSAFGISDEHKKYLSSGYRCPSCNASNTNFLGQMTTRFCDAEGKKLMLIAGGAVRGDTAECPKCGYRWKVYGTAPVAGPAADLAMEIVETERSDEMFGEDRRVIDNARSSSSLTRTITFSKEWTRTYEVQSEKAEGGGAEFSLGVKDTAGLKVSSEEKLRSAYNVSQETKETCSEQISYNVEAHTKLTVVVRWKRIWQHGYFRVTRGDAELHIPFRVAVGMTFDQEQIDGA
jgi:hypothetical protein